MKQVSADEVIEQIAEVLREASGEFIEDIANRVLGPTAQIKYDDDSMFKQAENKKESLSLG